jgi:hypothetical protein
MCSRPGRAYIRIDQLPTHRIVRVADQCDPERRDLVRVSVEDPSCRLISRVRLPPPGRLRFAETRLVSRHHFGDYAIAAIYADGAIGFVREDAPQTEAPQTSRTSTAPEKT